MRPIFLIVSPNFTLNHMQIWNIIIVFLVSTVPFPQIPSPFSSPPITSKTLIPSPHLYLHLHLLPLDPPFPSSSDVRAWDDIGRFGIWSSSDRGAASDPTSASSSNQQQRQHRWSQLCQQQHRWQFATGDQVKSFFCPKKFISNL